MRGGLLARRASKGIPTPLLAGGLTRSGLSNGGLLARRAARDIIMAIAVFSTWTTYGTWLPGDERGWCERGHGFRDPDALLKFEATLLMTEGAMILDLEQRQLVETTIVDHCAIRSWSLHAVSCRSNHVHVVVTASGCNIEEPREQFKAWCTRRLKERERSLLRDRVVRLNWWSDRGWDEFIDTEDSLESVMCYVLEGQGSRN